MRVKNPNLKEAELNHKGKTYRSDEQGVFDVPEDVASTFLSLPGFCKPVETVELREAVANYKQIEQAKKRIDRKFEDAKHRMIVEQMKADRGEGTKVDDTTPAPSTSPVEVDDDEDGPKVPASAPPPSAESQNPSTDAAKAAEIKARVGSEPNMRWKLDDLIEFAQAKGVECDSTWTKAQLIEAIEAEE